jgi:hypothetical protein
LMWEKETLRTKFSSSVCQLPIHMMRIDTCMISSIFFSKKMKHDLGYLHDLCQF